MHEQLVCATLAVLFFLLRIQSVHAQFVTNNVRSDATWRAINPAPAAGWNTDVAFDDSDAAGWEFAFKSPSGDNIWLHSNLSGQAPNQAWFRHVFFLNASPTSAEGRFFFDDNGQAYINGTLVVNDTGGGASTFNLQLDPALFHPGPNLVAVHGIDTSGPFNNIAVNMDILTVPEPATTWLLACGGVLLWSWRAWRRTSN